MSGLLAGRPSPVSKYSIRLWAECSINTREEEFSYRRELTHRSRVRVGAAAADSSTMMLDLGPFSEEKFDPKKWINSACHARHPEDSLDKHLVDMEMKLQMVSEEIAASLEEQSSAALLRVPRATRDIVRLRDDASSLRGSISGILQKLKKVPTYSVDIWDSTLHVHFILRRYDQCPVVDLLMTMCEEKMHRGMRVDLDLC